MRSQYLVARSLFMSCLRDFLQETQEVPETFQNDGVQDIPCSQMLEDADPREAIIVMLRCFLFFRSLLFPFL